jgi:hypothetical protein
MTTIPRPRVVSTSTGLEAEDLPKQVTVALRELADTVKEGLLAFSVGIGLAVLTSCSRPRSFGWLDPEASTIPSELRTGMATSLAR